MENDKVLNTNSCLKPTIFVVEVENVQNIQFLLIQKEYFFMSRGAVCLML